MASPTVTTAADANPALQMNMTSNTATPAASAPPELPDNALSGKGRRFSIAYGVISVAALLILSLWAGLRYYIHFEEKKSFADAGKLLSNFARTFEEHTVRTVRVLDQTTMFVKREYENQGNRLDLEKYAQEGLFLDRFYNLIAVIGEDGWVKLVNRKLPPSNVSDREHFQVHVQEDTQKLFISKPVLGRSSGKWSVQFTRRINKPDGGFGGIVVTSLDPDYFTEFYRSIEFGRNGVATLVGTDGLVRARQSADSKEIGQDVRNSELFRQLARADHGVYQASSPIDQVRRIYSYRKLKEYPLVVLVGMDEQDVLAEFNEHLVLLNLLGSAITILIIIAALAVLLLLRYQARVQESLQRSREEALSSSRMKSEFLARMSHELRTPLNGILGFSEYLRDGAEKPESREFAQTIHDAGTHLLSLVNATLDLAKIEAGKMDVVRQPVPLAPLVERAIALHQSHADKKALTLRTEFGDALPETILCDSTKVVQVLNNLINNAIKFTQQGSVTVRIERAGDGIRYAVTDTGPGIPADQHRLLFDRFRQLDTFATRSHEGSGLGLALAKELVELMGGRIGMESSPGAGSTFYFTLPVQ